MICLVRSDDYRRKLRMVHGVHIGLRLYGKPGAGKVYVSTKHANHRKNSASFFGKKLKMNGVRFTSDAVRNSNLKLNL